MRALKNITISGLILGGVSIFSIPSFAADQNTYRAGIPYLKTVASHFSQCERQCAGDAACRSWNFVRPNAGAASGVCEFNSRHATPISSSVSMSGTMKASIDPLMSRAIAGGTNTIRIGTPTIVAPKQVAQKRRAAPRKPMERRTVVRQPVPRQLNVRKASHTKPVNLKPIARNPLQRPNREAPKKPIAAPSAVAPNTAPQHLTPQQAYFREQYLAKKRQQERLQQQYRQQRGNALPRSAPPIPANMRSNRRASQAAQHARPQQFRPQARAPQKPLYGSLHDDLTRNMTRVPRPQTAPDNLKNPEAPLATSRAVPTKPVETKPLPNPALTDLVGG